MSTTSRPTSQLTLPGQTHTADGPHDMTGMYVMHHGFRRDLAAFEAAVRHTPVGDADVWAALRGRWARFAETLHHHHEVEDAEIWPVLLRRAAEVGEDDAPALLAAMEAEHEQVDPALEACTTGFAAMVDHPCADHRNALDVHLTTTHALLLDHLRHEETEALPLAQRRLTHDDWATSERAAQRAYPPRMMPFLLGWVEYGLDAEQVAELRTFMNPVQAVLARLVRRRFARGERRAFRYA
jgi:hemerythrin-like domain-containing protein